jgi:hypothetical protein
MAPVHGKGPSVLRGILEEEMERSARMEARVLKELESMPKGSLQVKVIRGREYLYRCFRDGKKVKSVFVPEGEAAALGALLARRRELEAALRRLAADRRLALRVLGRGRPGAGKGQEEAE